MLFNKLPVLGIVVFFSCAVIICPGGRVEAGQAKKDYKANEGMPLLFDENTPAFEGYYFDIKEHDRLKPRPNDFELVEFAPMSNKRGERWVLVTIRNTAGGRRFLTKDYLVATFANAHQANPSSFLKEEFDAGQTFTTTIPFGFYKFPIVLLEIQP